MNPRAFYNEIDPYAAAWLRNLIAAGHIAQGVVDERSIVDIRPDDIAGFTQVHFFAGIGGWSLAARLAGWPDDRPLWTGSCPCQPFSVAGKGAGQADARHLWPEFYRLIAACRPPVVMGEQVAAAVGKSWLDGVCSDLEGIGYACGAAVVPACAVNAPHRRDRLWFVADCESERGRTRFQHGQSSGDRNRQFTSNGCENVIMEDCHGGSSFCTQQPRRAETFGTSAIHGSSEPLGNGNGKGLAIGSRSTNERTALRSEGSASSATSYRSAWGEAEFLEGHDGKARRVKPGIRLLAHGIPGRVGKLRAFGNAIVPQVAAEIIGAYLDAAATVSA